MDIPKRIEDLERIGQGLQTLGQQIVIDPATADAVTNNKKCDNRLVKYFSIIGSLISVGTGTIAILYYTKVIQ
jgi:hypothetical protein